MTDNQSPWLKAAIAINEALKKEPAEVQEAIKRMDRKTYPETWKAIRDREAEGEQTNEQQ